MTLDKRISRLEDSQTSGTQDGAVIAERRALLAPYLAGPRFDSEHDTQREAILAALCESEPALPSALSYTLRLADDPLAPNVTEAAGGWGDGWGVSIFIRWPMRDSGGEPELTIFALPHAEQAPEEPEEEPTEDGPNDAA